MSETEKMPKWSFCLHLDTHYWEDSGHFYADEKTCSNDSNFNAIPFHAIPFQTKNTHYREDSSHFYAGEKAVLMILTLTLHHFKQRRKPQIDFNHVAKTKT